MQYKLSKIMKLLIVNSNFLDSVQLRFRAHPPTRTGRCGRLERPWYGPESGSAVQVGIPAGRMSGGAAYHAAWAWERRAGRQPGRSCVCRRCLPPHLPAARRLPRGYLERAVMDSVVT